MFDDCWISDVPLTPCECDKPRKNAFWWWMLPFEWHGIWIHIRLLKIFFLKQHPFDFVQKPNGQQWLHESERGGEQTNLIKISLNWSFCTFSEDQQHQKWIIRLWDRKRENSKIERKAKRCEWKGGEGRARLVKQHGEG